MPPPASISRSARRGADPIRAGRSGRTTPHTPLDRDRPALRPDQWQQALAIGAIEGRAGDGGDRRRKVRCPDRCGNDTGGPRRLPPSVGRRDRQLDQQRHADRGVVEKGTVGALAVLAKRFAVIGDDQNRRRREQAALPKMIEKPADRRVGIGHFAVVRAVAVRGGERRRWRVGRMRIEHMNPREERLRGVGVDRRLGRLQDRIGRSLDCAGRGQELVVVAVEPARQARRSAQQ